MVGGGGGGVESGEREGEQRGGKEDRGIVE